MESARDGVPLRNAATGTPDSLPHDSSTSPSDENAAHALPPDRALSNAGPAPSDLPGVDPALRPPRSREEIVVAARAERTRWILGDEETDADPVPPPDAPSNQSLPPLHPALRTALEKLCSFAQEGSLVPSDGGRRNLDARLGAMTVKILATTPPPAPFPASAPVGPESRPDAVLRLLTRHPLCFSAVSSMRTFVETWHVSTEDLHTEATAARLSCKGGVPGAAYQEGARHAAEILWDFVKYVSKNLIKDVAEVQLAAGKETGPVEEAVSGIIFRKCHLRAGGIVWRSAGEEAPVPEHAAALGDVLTWRHLDLPARFAGEIQENSLALHVVDPVVWAAATRKLRFLRYGTNPDVMLRLLVEVSSDLAQLISAAGGAEVQLPAWIVLIIRSRSLVYVTEALRYIRTYARPGAADGTGAEGYALTQVEGAMEFIKSLGKGEGRRGLNMTREEWEDALRAWRQRPMRLAAPLEEGRGNALEDLSEEERRQEEARGDPPPSSRVITASMVRAAREAGVVDWRAWALQCAEEPPCPGEPCRAIPAEKNRDGAHSLAPFA
mmetsp:Transcript_16003/g.36029  ORF Transcript_16003/g.36029 Transcript_16003/m.36029 type:complete len:554 (-) Transcript_16003:237-1898(-)